MQFTAHEEFFTFHDPMQNGKLIERQTEIRFDPLTGESSRIIYDPGAPFTPTDYTDLAKETEGAKCPFCSENIFSRTPTFPDELIEGGRLVLNETVVFPNLFPYSKHNAVVRMCDQHFVKPSEFTAPMIAQSFMAAHQYLQKVVESDAETKYASINWNYLPPSGGSILHPHIHVLASERPTNYQATIARASEYFYKEQSVNFFSQLVKTEAELDQRFIGSIGSIDWLHAFAPKGHTDFIGVFKAASFGELTAGHWDELAESMLRFLQYFEMIGIGSFNLGLFIPVDANESERVHVRLVPRFTSGVLDTSDINVFNFLHNEPLCLRIPEHTAKDVAKFFRK
ncbi:hypothetical protein AU377_05980 [Sporosarcina sp. HYO08]|nr:hypothetical protein AU377_05980 [Sporosarcina sp. HYO08]